jgi:hypothetical protein
MVVNDRSNISSLIPDIYKLVQTQGWYDEQHSSELSQGVSKRLAIHFNETKVPRLRLSGMGSRCPRALWYSIHHPELAEALPPWATIKYSYGHILEQLVITLAKAAGHEVTGEQDEVSVDGITGHRDCVIDGCVVDVKSSSSRSFQKFKDGSIKDSDTFGYLDQLDGYLVGSANDPLVRVKDRAYLLAIDKTLGHMVLYEHKVRPDSIRTRIKHSVEVVGLQVPPRCTCDVIPDGKSGNIRLDTKASYSSYKFCCFPNLRTFLYASGPVYLTHVARKPDVTEIDKHGKIVYN